MNPIINLNGTEGEELLAQYYGAMLALQHARDALYNASPNGRDYQANPEPDAYLQARRQHDERLRRIQLSLEEVETIAIDLSNQLHDRAQYRRRA